MPCRSIVCFAIAFHSLAALAEVSDAAFDERDAALAEIVVRARSVANDEPAGSVATVATALRFDPGIDLQSRGRPEGQSDITVQGGIFENTGIKVGAVNIFDPQTGHYAADLPISPESLSDPNLKTGIDNALSGFNSTVATLDYSLSQIQQGGHIGVGVGNDNLWYETLTVAREKQTSSGTGSIAGEFSYAGSRSDGSVPNGDHDFERFTARGQVLDKQRRSDVLIAYQDKFYGWPGAYTGFASLPETDHSKTLLLFVNHRQLQGDDSWWEIGSFYRALDDDYDFDRRTTEAGVTGAFEHETRSFAIGFQGLRRVNNIDWHVSGQLSSDELVRSTDLTEGEFTRRRYVSLSVAPEKRITLPNDATLRIQLGATWDASDRDRNVLLPLAGVSLQKPTARGTMQWSLEYAAASQLPGYTALKSSPAGLFGGNAALGRERADTLAIIMRWVVHRSSVIARLFTRQDDQLVDWTYLSGAPFARQANAVDIDVAGGEISWVYGWSRLKMTAAYAYLDKDADYSTAAVDASYYALNFAQHRVTMALTYEAFEGVEIRLDNEYRQQQRNALRTSGREAYTASLGIGWRPTKNDAFHANVVVDNLSDNDFQEFPGTPAAGRQYSISARYDW